MWYDEAEDWIFFIWIAAAMLAWLLPYSRGLITAAWAAPLTITAFCLGLYLGIENTALGRFKLPVGVVARQWVGVWQDYCADKFTNPERCDFLRELLRSPKPPL